MESLTALAAKHVADIVRLAIRHTDDREALVVFDARSGLSRVLMEAYRAALPGARFMDFDATAQEDVVATVRGMAPGGLVVLIQSMDFRLAEFRFRIELFQRGLATIEHTHLERASDDAQVAAYVDSLAFDGHYAPLGRAIKERLDAAERVVVRCAGTTLTYEGGMEPAKLNVGDYTGMKNVGGTFPIGEVFTEPKDLTRVNGEAKIFAFAGLDHLIQIHEPFTIVVREGVVVSHEGPPDFEAVLAQIRTSEEIVLREFGVGLNPAFGKNRVVKDITAFERQRGLHFSLGEKHTVYKKPGLIAKKTHYHIDIFVDVEQIEVDGVPLVF